jgi:DNA-binding Lrp family transcriptional regulator
MVKPSRQSSKWEAVTTHFVERDPQPPVDETDRRLVDLLSVDGRLPVSELALRAGISRANAYHRLARLRDSGVIRSFTVRIDPRRLGLHVTALVIVTGEQRSWRELRSELRELPGVEYVALTAGGFDFVLLVRVPDVETLRDVVLEGLQGMRGVRSTQTMFVLDEDDRRA